eukprot:22314-Eustigmatos_ZCMA.PRE.1
MTAVTARPGQEVEHIVTQLARPREQQKVLKNTNGIDVEVIRVTGAVRDFGLTYAPQHDQLSAYGHVE